MTVTQDEIASQPDVWREALRRAPELGPLLLAPGDRMLVLGCGTSAFVAQSFARLREGAGLGETDAAFASDVPTRRRYDRVLALTRSGTTTEVLEAIEQLGRTAATVALTATPDSPVQAIADQTVLLDFADETSIVQTRFPTATLVLALAAAGHPVDQLPDACAAALSAVPPVEPGAGQHFVFLGHDWTVGLAHEAALKTREAAQAWSESYPMLDYRHGPIAVADDNTVVWVFGTPPDTLCDDIAVTGATVVTNDLHPLVQLVQAQQFAMAVAAARGLDPDQPRNLTRSVILSASRDVPTGSHLIGTP